MIRAVLNAEIVNRLMSIERCQGRFDGLKLPLRLTDRLRKSSKKKSSYASMKIEGNPLTEVQVSEAIDSAKRHYLKPEQEVRNYFKALEFLEGELAKRSVFDMKLILDVQALVVSGESEEKIGLRGPIPPGALFAVYDDKTGATDYIPPESGDVQPLLDELIAYVAGSDDHPVIKAAIVHYQMVTIHPFEDGNGRTARLLSDYILDLNGYGFSQIGSLEEYFAYDIDEYYRSLQMGLPPLFYEGRENPPHPEIWISYFLRMMELHAQRVIRLTSASDAERIAPSLSHLGKKERAFLVYLQKHGVERFAPIDLAKPFKVSNRTVINWCAALVKSGFLVPEISGQRIRSYRLTDAARITRP